MFEMRWRLEILHHDYRQPFKCCSGPASNTLSYTSTEVAETVACIHFAQCQCVSVIQPKLEHHAIVKHGPVSRERVPSDTVLTCPRHYAGAYSRARVIPAVPLERASRSSAKQPRARAHFLPTRSVACLWAALSVTAACRYGVGVPRTPRLTSSLGCGVSAPQSR